MTNDKHDIEENVNDLLGLSGGQQSPIDDNEDFDEDEDFGGTYFKDDDSERDPNLISIQIETGPLLSRLEHLYRGDYLGPDKNGKLVWKKQKDPELITFNDYGVSVMMSILAKMLDKNTILSNYTREDIYRNISGFAYKLNSFLLANYEKMGMDSAAKRKRFGIIQVETLQVIEAAYLRALEGNTFKEINQSGRVDQKDHISNIKGDQQVKKRGGFIDRFFPTG